MKLWTPMQTAGAAALLVIASIGAASQAWGAPTTGASGVSGAITAVSDASITVQPKSGQPVMVAMNNATVVKVNGKVVAATDLKTGMNAIAFAEPGQPATEVRAYTATAPPTPHTAPSVAGVITQVGKGSITIQSGDGEPTVVAVNDTTTVKISGHSATLGDLEAGMRVIAFVKPEQPAAEIRAYPAQPASTQPAPRPTVSGTITVVGEGNITIQPSSGQAVTVTVNAATVVKVNTKVVTAADLKGGLRVVAFVEQGRPATEIRAYLPQAAPLKATPLPTVSGSITQVGNGSITILPKEGQAVVVPLDANTGVKVGGKAATAADLKVGMNAFAVVPQDKPATEVRAYMPSVP